VDETASHGGLYRIENGGETWTNIFDEPSNVYGVTVDKNNSALELTKNDSSIGLKK